MDLREALVYNQKISALDPADLDILMAAFREETTGQGDTLAVEGSPGDSLFVLLEGQLTVVTHRGPAQAELQRLDPGALVGLVSLVDRAGRSAGIVVTEAGRVGRLSRRDYDALSLRSPSARIALDLAIGAQLAQEFRRVAAKVSERIAQLASRRAPPRAYDVVVIGGGPNGLAYAIWVKQKRPQTAIAVVDKRTSPGFKIGESTLASSLFALLSLGLTMPMLRRLFNTKFGLHFWWTGPHSDGLEMHVNGSDFDETFQVERRVLETALNEVARRLGIEVYQGTRVELSAEDLEPDLRALRCEGPGTSSMVLQTRLVCDASGPASVIPRLLGLYRKDVDSIQTNAYFGYFRKRSEPDVPGWDVTATRHVCFPEGWVWFIQIASWERASDENLQRMVSHVLDFDDLPDEALPTRFELSAKFDCPVEQIVSIGVVPRTDLDSSARAPIEERFWHYCRKYPGLERIMGNYELIGDAYRGRQAFTGFVKMAHTSSRFTGDGWLAVGDAAFFVNPLYSPGLAFGLPTTHVAAAATVEALDRGDVSAGSFSGYEQAAHEAYTTVLNDNEMHYRSYRDRQSYERVTVFKFSNNGEGLAEFGDFFERLSATGRAEGLVQSGPPSPVAGGAPGGAVDPRRMPIVRRIVELARSDEARGVDAGATAARITAVVDDYLSELRAHEGFAQLGTGRTMADYDDMLTRVEGKHWEPPLATRKCRTCESRYVSVLRRCSVCGAPAPPSTTA
jgi:flavin-dependent dehydrogenase/CRP-like cAMP-binding protein